MTQPLFSRRAADGTLATDIIGARDGWLLSGGTRAGDDLCGASRGRREQAGFVAAVDASGHLTKERRIGQSAEIDALARMPDGSLAVLGFDLRYPEEGPSSRTAFASDLTRERPLAQWVGFEVGNPSAFQRCQEIWMPEPVPFVARVPGL